MKGDKSNFSENYFFYVRVRSVSIDQSFVFEINQIYSISPYFKQRLKYIVVYQLPVESTESKNSTIQFFKFYAFFINFFL